MAAVDTIFEQLGSMTVLELVELKNKIEEEGGITAAAPVAAAAPARGGGGGAGGGGGRSRGRRGEDGIRRRPHRGRRPEDPGDQGRPRRHRARPQGGQGPRRLGPPAGQGGRRPGRGRHRQGAAGRGRRLGRDQVDPRAERGREIAWHSLERVVSGGTAKVCRAPGVFPGDPPSLGRHHLMKLKALLLALAVAGAGASFAFADDNPGGSTTTGATTTTTTTGSDGCRRFELHGTLASVAASSFVVAVKKGSKAAKAAAGQSVTVAFDAQTRVSWSGRGTLTGPNAGDGVHVNGKRCGDTYTA